MEDSIKIFIEAKEYLLETIPQKIDVFLMGIWDPIVKHSVIKETIDIIENELIELFPNLPLEYLPKCKFRIIDEDMEIEAGVQNYYNHEPGLTFLGSTMIGYEIFDCYYRDSYDPRFEYTFISRYGHEVDDYYVGSKTAEAEYYLGQQTPLSIAYGLAIEDGFIG
jgi:hypothetical protein